MAPPRQVIRITEECLGVANCVAIAPDIFALNDDGFSTLVVDRIPKEAVDAIETAVRNCPTGAIEIVDDLSPRPR